MKSPGKMLAFYLKNVINSSGKQVSRFIEFFYKVRIFLDFRHYDQLETRFISFCGASFAVVTMPF